MKNIVLCSDGTGNAGGRGYGSNVWHLFRSLDLNGHIWDPELCEQVAYHDDGVGTRDNPLHRLWGQATGWGLSQNIRQLYMFLVNNYEPGDRIYIFGFSRGAYTARSLAGLIAMCGVVDRRRFDVDELEKLSQQALRILRSAFVRGVSRWLQGETAIARHEQQVEQAARQFRAKYAVNTDDSESCEVPIEFVGVWDTVDAYGFPSDTVADWVHFLVYAYKFPDTRLSRLVRAGRQAIAIDDERRTFHPVLWDSDAEFPDRIKQVWFAGVHANVGGGYPKQGLAMISLDWMMSEAEAVRDGKQGLRFISESREAVRRSANPYDKLYNSRTGLALAYGYDPRELETTVDAHGFDKPAVHESVVRRIKSATEDYSPLSLPCEFEIALTQGTHADIEDIEAIRLAMCKALAAAAKADTSGNSPLSRGLGTWIRLRRSTNWVLFWSALVTLLAPWIVAVWSSLQWPDLGFATAVWRETLPWLAIAWLAVWQITAYAKRRMRNETNRFWRNVFRNMH